MIGLSRSSMPRETRDTLFMLLVVAWVVVPMYEELPWWCGALSLALMLWRGSLAWLAQPLPSRWWLLALVALCVVATLVSFRTVFGRDAGVTLIVVLLALKTLELRARRDAFVVFFLCFFLMLTRFFYSQSLLSAVGMFIGLLGLLTALVNAHTITGPAPLWQSARQAIWMMMLGAPVMLTLFLLFPRIAPLWGLPSQALSAKSGLSASMEVGNVASLALDPSVAFRIRFDGPAPATGQLYFRGPVLSEFDGRQWRAPFGALVLSEGKVETQGSPIGYELTLQPHQQAWLLSLEATVEAPTLAGVRIQRGADLQWLKPAGVQAVTRYRAQAYPNYRYGQNLSDPARARYLAMPAASNPRTRQWARDLIQQAPEPLRRVQEPNAARHWMNTAMGILRDGGYRYTLEPGVFGQHTADEFWFDRKSGFCEHIASSFVVLMRMLGVPARIVTGYQGAEQNPLDDFWTVRQSDAHAWAEVWLADQGWQRVDPTSAVAPQRTSSLQRPAGAAPDVASAILGRISPTLVWQVRLYWDAINNRWNQWVLNYEQANQLELLLRLGVASPSWEDLVVLLSALVVFASLVAAAITGWNARGREPWLSLLDQARKRIQAVSTQDISANATPRELCVLIENARQNNMAKAVAARDWLDWLHRLEQQRYGPPKGQAQTPHRPALATLRRQFGQLPPLSRPTD